MSETIHKLLEKAYERECEINLSQAEPTIHDLNDGSLHLLHSNYPVILRGRNGYRANLLPGGEVELRNRLHLRSLAGIFGGFAIHKTTSEDPIRVAIGAIIASFTGTGSYWVPVKSLDAEGIDDVCKELSVAPLIDELLQDSIDLSLISKSCEGLPVKTEYDCERFSALMNYVSNVIDHLDAIYITRFCIGGSLDRSIGKEIDQCGPYGIRHHINPQDEWHIGLHYGDPVLFIRKPVATSNSMYMFVPIDQYLNYEIRDLEQNPLE